MQQSGKEGAGQDESPPENDVARPENETRTDEPKEARENHGNDDEIQKARSDDPEPQTDEQIESDSSSDLGNIENQQPIHHKTKSQNFYRNNHEEGLDARPNDQQSIPKKKNQQPVDNDQKSKQGKCSGQIVCDGNEVPNDQQSPSNQNHMLKNQQPIENEKSEHGKDTGQISKDEQSTSHENYMLTNACRACILCLTVLTAICITYVIRESQSEISNARFPSTPEGYRRALNQLKTFHDDQDERFWRIINATMKNHIFQENPQQPAVLMLGSAPYSSAIRERLAMEIANVYSIKCNESKPVLVNGSELEDLNHAEAKQQIDEIIHAGLSGEACTVIISGFEKLPPASTTIFYQFCENDHAPFKKVLILFTTEVSTNRLPVGATPNPRMWSRTVEDFIQASLQERDDTGKMTVDMIGGLLTRITPLVGWVNNEKEKGSSGGNNWHGDCYQDH